MNDVLGVFNRMKDMYIRYMDSPFALGHEKLMEEREAILSEEGNIYQYPYIEALPPFKSSNKNVVNSCKEIGWATDFGEFASKGLFGRNHNLHLHQFQAFKEVLKNKKNVVVTSGTGSGKTESFLLPLIANILNEAKGWEKPGEKTNPWWQLGDKWKPMRSNETRLPAIRGLILYPLNALVEDQLVRLRKALDSKDAKTWLDQNRNGNRIHFGRYTGKTPVPGEPSNMNKVKKLKEISKQMSRKQDQLEKHFMDLIQSIKSEPSQEMKQKVKLELQSEISGDLLNSDTWSNDEILLIRTKLKQKYQEKLTFINQVGGSEMISRWDMQEYPPDILITNFSMLNIILTRSIEQKMFEKTKQWLEEDPNNIFYLVLDELHTYRGTAGTEVAYVIRALLSRLGLSPESPQLRVIATSASLDESGKEFLEQFFGLPVDKFQIISGAREGVNFFEQNESNRKNSKAFMDYYNLCNKNFVKAVEGLCKEFNQPFNSYNVEESLYIVLNKSGFLNKFIKVCEKPTSLKKLNNKIFGSNCESINAIGGLLHAIINARTDGDVVIPIRAHLFFRNFQGLWACSNSECSAVNEKFKYDGRKIGKLYNQPRVQCSCGSRVLDFYYCQNCGDSFLGGYKSKGEGEDVYYLSADYPDLDSLPDKIPLQKKYGDYALFWPSINIDEDIKTWQRTPDNGKGKLKFTWVKGNYENKIGKIKRDISFDEHNAYLFLIEGDDNSRNRMPAFPIKCPHCADDWESKSPKIKNEPLESTKRTRSPIRGQKTGFDMIAQIMLDSLIRELPDNEAPKAVLFSDSRQDAAKLSAKIELNHYYHILRYIVVSVMGNEQNPLKSFIKQVQGQELNTMEKLEAEEYLYNHETQAMLLQSYYHGGLLAPQRREQIKRLLDSIDKPVKLMELWKPIELSLIKLGINPGGTDHSLNELGGYKWVQLYDWSNLERPVPRLETLPIELDKLGEEIRGSLKDNVLANVLFSQRKRDLESLCLARLTTDFDMLLTENMGKNPEFWRQLVDSSIRILGGLRRYDLNRTQSDNPPSLLKNYWKAVAKANNLNEEDLIFNAKRIFENLKGVKDYLINSDEIYIVPAEQNVYECQKCGRNHLHASCNVCTDCFSPLEENTLEDIKINDYYRFLSKDKKTYRRFHSEEMTGQTDSGLASRRQQLFQSIYDFDDIPLVDEIDILSVTTTMEAGVDIGSLQLVAMSNMPPQRFNYQQRVGRCGRRGSALSISLTLCRGRSHDDWYFDNLDSMTGDPPPQPYIDLKSQKIFSRVLFKEILFHAFNETGLIEEIDGGESVHGEFGHKDDWELYKDRIQSYFQSNEGIERLNQIIMGLSYQSKVKEDEKQKLKTFIIKGELTKKITGISKDSRYSSNSLSENLAAAGLLPMFGFPTRVRLFHHERRTKTLPPQFLENGTVDRDLEIAISEYSPGSEIIKDKVKHKAVGIAHYWVRGRQIVAEENPLGMIRNIAICTNCHILFDKESIFPKNCPSCGSPMGEDNSFIFRKIPISEPQGFRSEWIKRDYNEEFEWSSRSSVPRLADDALIKQNINQLYNIKYSSQEGNVYSINDNYGQLFTFQKAKNTYDGWIDTTTVNKDGFRPYLSEDVTETVALASIKNTEVLVVGPDDIMPGITFDPTNLGVKSGLISFGYLFRRVATSILDVDADELQVGIRSKVDSIQNRTIGEIFIADRLINGAGYSKHLSNKKILDEVITDLTEKFIHIPTIKEHNCDTSCYDCLRTYENMGYHPILDWRLALDVASIFRDSKFIPSIDYKWKGTVNNAINSILANYGGTSVEWRSGMPILTLPFPEKSVSIIFVHPFWEKRERKEFSNSLLEITESLEKKGHMTINYDIFDLIRRPNWVIMNTIERKNQEGDLFIW
ncbi:DEAD/DEAH box helicase [Neobacillus sp. DY30]|uniref:DEAD/DEAH box helicase n=1 Tax=Neobacillus sp. DY30 TaxID=3047871 RepID=UPI0024BF8545|nr:DEAD/DEAH box helicase [Neobacillus sp. DY30]WHY03396.1 DEAD/DEAH box helicase [Neobacillus sp. DY30]